MYRGQISVPKAHYGRLHAAGCRHIHNVLTTILREQQRRWAMVGPVCALAFEGPA